MKTNENIKLKSLARLAIMLVMVAFVTNLIDTTFDSFFEEVDHLELCENKSPEDESEEDEDLEDVLHKTYWNVNEFPFEAFTMSLCFFHSNFQLPELSELTPPPERA